MNYYFEDFTEEGYRYLLRLAKMKYHFIGYEDYKNGGRNIIWRHDIDLSVHRAFRLAKIEAEEGVKSTYFIHLHSEFYNALEYEIRNLIKNIISLGHFVGLHFDPNFYGINIEQIDLFDFHILKEKELLERLFDQKIKVFSFHNPEQGQWINFCEDECHGMLNTYGECFKNYGYCSDSNGYWRFRRLTDVLKEADGNYQILTHPGWWTPEAMSPRDRISRAINGRADAQHKKYDFFINDYGRENIR